jgi:Dolichyl-phosphate-mannose-protein mannosyltransferase
MTEQAEPIKTKSWLPLRIRLGIFIAMVLVIVGLAVVRSAIATRLDSFTLDEAYHIAAGVSYVRYHDFRINPEHPPLVKLWVGSFISATGFALEPLEQFSDKPGEREFTQTAVYLKNDPDSVQRRARAAMFALNGLLLVALALAVRRVFGEVVALGALLFLAIDPTVAAHLPVVMTDLPVALLAATAVVLAIQAFREWQWRDLAWCSFFLGLTLTAKHSAPVVILSVLLIGAVLAFARPLAGQNDSRVRRALKLATVFAGALFVLWGAYLFRYYESPGKQDVFNRPLASKIAEVPTPSYHFVLTAMNVTRVVPRAYLWGFADTIHAGMEGRPFPQIAFGHYYFGKGPRYFFPAMLTVKLPIGLLLLALLGIGLFLSKRVPAEWGLPAGVVLTVIFLFLLVLASGATYAGIRHELPVVVLLSVFAGMAVAAAVMCDSKSLKIVVVLSYIVAGISAIPVLRPWEYFNEFVGGAKNAHNLFSDEGVDLGQRTKEYVAYYNQFLKPMGEKPALNYWTSIEELKARGVDYLGRDVDADMAKLTLPEYSGTIIAGSHGLFRHPVWDFRALRESTPAARFGNIFIYRGTYYLPALNAEILYWHGVEKQYGALPDEAAAEQFYRQAIAIDPSAYFVDILVANYCLKRGEQGEALKFYAAALKNAPEDKQIQRSIEEQIERVSHEPAGQVPTLRNPFME